MQRIPHTDLVAVALGQPGLQLRGGGGGVDRAPWLDPPLPQKGLN